MSIFIILGTSSAGKSMVCNAIRSKKPEWAVFDIDEEGVPEHPTKEWRRERTNQLLKKVKENQEKDVILCGVIVPSEVKESKEYTNEIAIHYIFLKVNEEIIKERLEARAYSEKEIADNINWSNYLEEEVKNQENQTIVDASEKTKDEVLEEILKIIESQPKP
jgi:broad-specificity NMP kinase